MRKTLLLISALLIIAGCNKDKTLPTFTPDLYESDGHFEDLAVTMYVKGGSITDTAFIKAYLQRTGYTNVFNMPGEEHPPVVIKFDSRVEDSIRLSLIEGIETRFSHTYNKVNYQQNTALFLTADTLTIPTAEDGEISCSNAAVLLRKYAPLPDCAANPLGAITCKAREQLPVEMNGDKLKISVMHLSYSSRKDVRSCLSYQRYILDQLNKEPLRQMHENDTLVLQTSTVVLERK